MVRKHQADDEAGVVLILSVILLVVLLGISALVIDIGYAKAQNRSMQNAADASSLGSAQDLVASNPATVGCVGTAAAIAECDAKGIGGTNQSGAVLNWASASCNQDPLGGAQGWVHGPTTNCVSFDSSFEQVRVRIPQRTFQTLFGGILGFRTVSTSTLAIAGLHTQGNTAVLPFLLFSGFSNGEACIDQAGTGKVAPCGGPTSGNFDALDFHQYGNSILGTTPDCTSGGQNRRLTGNTAMGADHLYSQDPNNTIAAINDDCVQFKPNQVTQGTGNGNAFDEGLLSGNTSDPNIPDGKGARLTRFPTSSAFPGWESTTVTGDVVDNRPFWEFIPQGTTLPNVPNSCQRATFDAKLLAAGGLPVTQRQAWMHAAINQCIYEYACGKSDLSNGVTVNDDSCTGARAGLPLAECSGAPCTGPLLIADTVNESGLNLLDIQDSPRFAYVPQVWQPDVACSGSSGSYCYHIMTFRAVFLQRTLANNSSQLDFEPDGNNVNGWNPASQGSGKAAALTGFVLPPSMLPNCLGAGVPTAACPDTDPVQVGRNAIIQLSR
jgi:hypothetical protein